MTKGWALRRIGGERGNQRLFMITELLSSQDLQAEVRAMWQAWRAMPR